MTTPATKLVLLASIGLLSAVSAAEPVKAPPPPPPFTSDAPVAPAVESVNGFGLDFYRALAKSNPDHNLFLSPYSVSVALTMAAEGAREETETEMARVLHFPAAAGNARAISPVHEAVATLSQRLVAAGTTDPKAKARADELRVQLDAANKESQKFAAAQDWAKAGESQSNASKIAAELNTLLTQIERFDLRIANALWVERSYDLSPAYVQTIDHFYGSGGGGGSGVTPLNIARDPEGSRSHINAWVADHTEQRIKDIIPPGGLAPSTRLVIANAVYFKGQWATPFEQSGTKDEEFTAAGGAKLPVKMMHAGWRWAPYAAFSGNGSPFATPHKIPKDESKRPATYPDDAGFTMIELPYKGGDLSMLVLSPRSASGLPALESKLSPEALAGWIKHLEARTVDTAVPRFKVESEINAAATLQALGMRRAFTDPAEKGGAQFAGISASQDPSQQLYIGSVLHKAWVDVAEKGTEAAAATVVTFAPTSAAVQREETVPFTPVFRADHPFLFVIRDTKSGVILFIGRVASPKAE
ncbi:MAG: serpin family protein [Phycisphaerales bacterium]